MIESPVLQEFAAECRRKSIMVVLTERFGSMAETVGSALGPITDSEKLDELTRIAVKCPDVETFEQLISSMD
jgi:hypothetical protein